MEIPLPFSRLVNLKKPSTAATIGYTVIILSAVFTGLINTFAKPLLENTPDASYLEISPITLVALIFLINGLFFTPLTKNSASLRQIGRRNIMLVTLAGIAEAAALITYFFGLKDTTAINASILSEGEIIFSILIALTFFRERLRKRELTPFAMIIVGILIIPVSYDVYSNGMHFTDLVFGDMLIILAGLFYALDINVCKYVSKRIDAKRITQLASFGSAAFALLLIFTFNIPISVDISQIPSIVVISIIGTGMSTFFFIIALRLIGAVRTLLLYSSQSVFGVIFATIFLGEAVTIANVISITLVMGGIFLLRNRLATDEDETTEKSHKRCKIISKIRKRTVSNCIFEVKNGLPSPACNPGYFDSLFYRLGRCLLLKYCYPYKSHVKVKADKNKEKRRRNLSKIKNSTLLKEHDS